MMRTEFFFIAHLKVLRSWLKLLLRHLALSFNPQGTNTKQRILVRLGRERYDLRALGYDTLMKPSILSIEPLAGSGPLIDFAAVPHRSLGIESLELLMPLVKIISGSTGGIMPLIVHMSQIPCHRVHAAPLDYEGIARCHRAMVQKILLDLGKLELRNDQTIALVDHPELLGYKNSALLERLFFNK